MDKEEIHSQSLETSNNMEFSNLNNNNTTKEGGATAATVTFNVGGIIYQVRRSLLEDHPNTLLARSASKLWTDNGNSGKSIFFDQDGQRFRFCLEYMRNGTVQLPLTESKVALLNDLQYYGFEDVDPDSINDSRAIVEAVSYVRAHAENAQNRIKAIEQTIQDLQIQKTHEEQALFLFKEFSSGKSSFQFDSFNAKEKYDFFRNINLDYFQTILAANGLKLVNKKEQKENQSFTSSQYITFNLECL